MASFVRSGHIDVESQRKRGMWIGAPDFVPPSPQEAKGLASSPPNSTALKERNRTGPSQAPSENQQAWVTTFITVAKELKISAALDTNILVFLLTPGADHERLIPLLQAFDQKLVILPRVMKELRGVSIHLLPAETFQRFEQQLTIETCGQTLRFEEVRFSEDELKLAGKKITALREWSHFKLMWNQLNDDVKILCEAAVTSNRPEFSRGIVVLTNDLKAAAWCHLGNSDLGAQFHRGVHKENVRLPAVVSCVEAGLRLHQNKDTREVDTAVNKKGKCDDKPPWR